MKEKIFASITLLALLTACDDHYDDQFNINPGITDVKDIAVTLETFDYGSISELTANQELAPSKGPEGKMFVKALEAVGTSHYFTEEAPAEDYIPTYLKSKYPNADAGSKFVMTYKLLNPSNYMDDFEKLSTYDLTEEDYKTVWGKGVKASFLSPSAIGKIPGVLSNTVKNPTGGGMKVVNYAYSATGPSIGGDGGEGKEPAPAYTSIADLLKLTPEGEYTSRDEVVAVNAESSIFKDDTGLIRVCQGKLVTCSMGDVVEVSGKVEMAKQGMNRFSSKAIFKVLERKPTFAYPAAKSMTVTELRTYANNTPDIQYVTYEGTFKRSGNNINIILNGGTSVQGSITGALLIDDSWADKTVVMAGYLAGVSGSSTKYINIFATPVTVKGEENKVTPVSVIVYSAVGEYTVKGLATAINTRGFILTDGAGDTLVYKNTQSTEKVGGMVEVKGTAASKNGAIQFGNKGLTVTSISTGSTIPVAMVPQTFSAAKFTAYAAAQRIVYVSFERTLDIKDSRYGCNYYNVKMEGVEKDAAFSYVDESKIDAALNGKKIAVKGYLVRVNKGGHPQVVATFVEEVTATHSLAATRAATVSPTAPALYVYDGENKTWKPYTLKEAKPLMAEPALYESLGTDMIERPETVLPTYLKQEYPYAVMGDMVAVVYNKKADTSVVAEYMLGEDWTETASCKLVTTTFTQGAESISAEVSMYLNETSKKNTGSFTAQDIFLNDVNWVWKLDSYNYMRASAYANKTSHAAESWLVSPVMNFKKSKTPELLFDHACRLRTETPSDNLNVMVSADYSDDVKTATWTALTVEDWTDGTKWDFMSNKIDLSVYNGQKVTIAFKYVSTDNVAPIWEVQNVVVREKVTEREGEESGDAETPAE